MEEIFALVRANDAIRATGHISVEEHYAVVKSFAGLGKVIVNHAGERFGRPGADPLSMP